MRKLVFSDVDGVLTDSKIHIGDDGEVFKSFDVKDGYGIAQWCDHEEREFVIVTARESHAVQNRAKELGVEYVYQGVNDKAETVERITSELGYELEETVYIGDDHSDIGAMERVEKACCPTDATRAVKAKCDYICPAKGGEGAVRAILNKLQSELSTVLGVIPARYGSTRLPGKPLEELVGKPMIQHVYQRANKATLLDELVVATDDTRIINAVESIDGTAVMTDSDHSTGTDRVAEVAEQHDADFVVNIQGDEPLIDPAVIDSVVDALRQHKPRVATPISTITDEEALNDENIVKVVTDRTGKALYFSRSKIPSGSNEGSAYKHIGLYGFETDLLLEYVTMDSQLEQHEDLEQLRLLENGYDIQTIITDYEAVEVNVESDIPIVERRLQEEQTDGPQ